MTTEISRSVLDAIAQEAAGSPDREICGLLFGDGDRIAMHRSCANVAERPADSFEIDPAALIAAYRAERTGGPRIAGCYHSHPHGPAHPSRRDADAAATTGWLWLIAAGGSAAAYRATDGGAIHGRFEPVGLHVVRHA